MLYFLEIQTVEKYMISLNQLLKWNLCSLSFKFIKLICYKKRILWLEEIPTIVVASIDRYQKDYNLCRLEKKSAAIYHIKPSHNIQSFLQVNIKYYQPIHQFVKKFVKINDSKIYYKLMNIYCTWLCFEIIFFLINA